MLGDDCMSLSFPIRSPHSSRLQILDSTHVCLLSCWFCYHVGFVFVCVFMFFVVWYHAVLVGLVCLFVFAFFPKAHISPPV
jgi:hypothetical protein